MAYRVKSRDIIAIIQFAEDGVLQRPVFVRLCCFPCCGPAAAPLMAIFD